MKKRTLALIVVVIFFIASGVANWLLNNWLDSNVTEENVSRAITFLTAALDYISGPIGFGFILGALVFSIWDWPFVGLWFKKLRERFRNKEDDEVLAAECEEISKYLYEQAALLERVRNERHWQGASRDSSADMKKSWAEARALESREEERIRREIGHRVQGVFVRLDARGVKLDLWGFSLSHYELASASYLFANLANALREGNYLERDFKAGRSGGNMPARM